MVNVLRKLFADRLADFHVGHADEIVGGREPAEVGHGLQVPDDDARLHPCRHSFIISIFNAPGLIQINDGLSLAAP